MNESKFTGGVLGDLGTKILIGVATVFTLGIGAPWALCYRNKWIAEHTVIDGRNLAFDGKGAELLVACLKWLLFYIVTIGIYGLWIPVKYRAWVVEHTHNK